MLRLIGYYYQMKTPRIRSVNVLELDQAIFDSTYQISLELANILKASLHVSMLHTKEQKEFYETIYGSDFIESQGINENQISNILSEVKKRGGLLDFGFSIEHFNEEDSIRQIFGKLSPEESLSVLGYNKSPKHQKILKKLLKHDLGNPIMLIPIGKKVESFHKLIVPFDPEFITKRKLINLKWYADQFGVMIDFVHFKKTFEEAEKNQLKEVYDMIFDWINTIGFSNIVHFRFPISNSLNEGLKDYLKDQSNYLLCILDNQIKKSICTSSSSNECLTDIKEAVVIL